MNKRKLFILVVSMILLAVVCAFAEGNIISSESVQLNKFVADDAATYEVYYHPDGSPNTLVGPDIFTSGTKTRLRIWNADSFPDYVKDGEYVDAWKIYRESTGEWMLTADGTTGKWMALEGGELPAGYDYLPIKNLTSPGGNVHAYPIIEEKGYTLYYHADDDADGSYSLYIPYSYSGAKVTIASVAVLGFSKEGYDFTGWREKRQDSDGIVTWRAYNSEGKADWIAAAEVTDKTEYVVIGNEWEIGTPFGSGELHLYAQWAPVAGPVPYSIYYHPDGTDSLKTGPVQAETETQTRLWRWMDEEFLPYVQDGKVLTGWRMYRESDRTWFVRGSDGETSWITTENDTLPSGYSFLSVLNVTSPTKVSGDTIHLYPEFKDNGYTLYYHAAEGEAPCSETLYIPYSYSDKTVTIKSLSALGFSKAGNVFTGWKEFKEETDEDGNVSKTWRAYDSTGAKVWIPETEVTDTTEYVIIGDEWEIGSPLGYGELHLYAQWTTAELTVTDPLFGAIADDKGDDRDAIQKALNYARASNDTITVIIPKGTYHISRQLFIYSNTKLIADGATIIRDDDSKLMLMNETPTEGVYAGGYGRTTDIVIQGGTWNGNASGKTPSNLFYISHAQNVTITGATLTKCCGTHFIELSAVADAKVTGCKFTNFVKYSGTDYSVIENPSGEKVTLEASATAEAIQLDYAAEATSAGAQPYDRTACKNITVSKCTFTNCLSGIGNHHADQASSGLSFTGNTFSKMINTCFNLQNMSGVTISSNKATNVFRFIYATKTSGKITVSKNTVSNSTASKSSGISLESAKGFTISGNTVKGFVNGVLCQKSSEAKITGNTIGNCAGDELGNGIRMIDSKGDITGNTIDNTDYNGISATNYKGNITKNTVTNSGKYNIFVSGKNSSGNINGNQYDLGFGIYCTDTKMTRGTNSWLRDGEPGPEATGITVYYHLNENAEASPMTTEVEASMSVRSLTTQELGFTVSGKRFTGWRLWRNDLKRWRIDAKDAWPKTLPSNPKYYLLTEGGKVKGTTVTKGAELHLYAQWESVGSTKLEVLDVQTKYDALPVGEKEYFTVTTQKDAKYLFLMNNDSIVKTWDAAKYSTVSGDKRLWKEVSVTATSEGEKVLSFRTGLKENKPVSNRRFGFFRAKETGVITAEAAYDVIGKGGTQTFTVKTTKNCKYLVLYAENGKTVVKTWTADSKNSKVEGLTRTWNVSLSISGTGNRKLTLKAGTAKTPKDTGEKVSFLVAQKRTVSAGPLFPAVTKDSSATFTVRTTADVDTLMLYDADGKMLKSWTADSKNSSVGTDKIRTWTVSWKLTATGTPKLTFRGGVGSTTPVTGWKTTSINVIKNGVLTVKVAKAKVVKKKEQTFTVTTTKDCKYLMIYAENGKTLVKSWAADSKNSKVSGNIRTWTVKLSFSGTGKRQLVVKAGTGKTPTAAAQIAAFTVTAK